MIGTSLGPYKILEPLGAGGMGEVYLAEDTRLGRKVAIKVLPEGFATDPERLARFEREARLLAALNHAHIAGIYGFEDIDGVRFTAMELVEGDTLEARMSRPGGLELEEALDIARQIAEALEAAHENGIVHRDLKPANVKITPQGSVKVLDFGLAKAFLEDGTPAEMSPDLSRSPTMMQATGAGMILGTAAYMSPEQARGKPVDKRADIWSFGVVLFEMLTGRQPFRGETLSDTLADLLRGELDWETLPAHTPQPVRTLLHRCLERDPGQRLRDIGEARIALDRVLRGSGVGPGDIDGSALGAPARATQPAAGARSSAAPQAGGGLGMPLWIAIVVLTGLVAGFAGWSLRPASDGTDSYKLGFSVDGLDEVSPVISPDGRMVAFSAQGHVWVRELTRAEARELPGTEGAMQLFWSPDSAAIGYMSAQHVHRVNVDGGRATEVVRLPSGAVAGVGGAWGPGDRIVFTRGNTGFYRVSARGGDPELLLEPPGVAAGDRRRSE